ncbi:hypothetical protein SeLEV6574_g04203 [Synchytrium endobioticum]|uniref:Carbohydrate kinase FGGY N-terminal domain-containing protein n=1 Tax=Synchytrium endobioticum TaxID=286115 RepID=A0A507D0T2_9FUNG|nr:hypothetical protein SeLEV6574_g04203 [Synchytrium endobioticum]
MTAKLVGGIDASTQQLKFVAIALESLQVVQECSVSFDNELPHYNTRAGVLVNGLQVTAPTLMWVEALDLLMAKLVEHRFPFGQVVAISGSAQQHGSVYWMKGAGKTIASLSGQKPLLEQLSTCITPFSPVWLDSSTAKECKEMEELVGGAQALAEITGSKAYERSKISRRHSDIYDRTERVSLVSSFMCSLFIGKHAGIDASDGSGMNLVNIETGMGYIVITTCQNRRYMYIFRNVRYRIPDNERSKAVYPWTHIDTPE